MWQILKTGDTRNLYVGADMIEISSFDLATKNKVSYFSIIQLWTTFDVLVWFREIWVQD